MIILKWFLIILVIAAYFVEDAVTADIYDKKGLGKTKGAFVGLIPVYGLVKALRIKTEKEIHPRVIRQCYMPKELLMKLLVFLELVVLSVIVVLPVVYIIGSSLSNTNQLPTTFWPEKISFEKYKYLLTETNFKYWYKNTIIIA